MKGLLCFILLCNVCSCLGDSEEWGNYRRAIVKDEHYGYKGGDYGRNDRYDRDDKTDHHDPIIRPCSLHDVNCIRNVFAKIFLCSPVYKPVPDPYFTDTLSMDFPSGNSTVTINNVILTGLSSGKIKEFYINKKTDTLVLEVVFDSVGEYSSKTVLTHHRRGKEPIELSDFTDIEFKSLSLTLLVSNIGALQKSKSHVYAYLADANLPFKIGPGHFVSKDPEVMKNIKQLTDNLPLTVREAFLKQGPFFMSIFLKNKLCNLSLY